MRKLPARSQTVLIPLFLSFLMSLVVSMVATLKAVGFEPGLAGKVLQAWSVSFPVAFPSVMLLLPLVRRMVGAMVEAR